jgi:hypothetical protein
VTPRTGPGPAAGREPESGAGAESGAEVESGAGGAGSPVGAVTRTEIGRASCRERV